MWSFLPGTLTPAELVSMGIVLCACFLNWSQSSQRVGSASLWLLAVFFADMPEVMSLSRQGSQGCIGLVAIQLPLTTIAHTCPRAFKILPMLLFNMVETSKLLRCPGGHQVTPTDQELLSEKRGCGWEAGAGNHRWCMSGVWWMPRYCYCFSI